MPLDAPPIRDKVVTIAFYHRFSSRRNTMAATKRTKRLSKEETLADPLPTPLLSRPKSLVFISHDSRDGDLAEALATLLSDVSAGTLKSFRSSDKKGNTGIEFGAEWYTAIMSQLDDATDVIALLTQQSVDRPWILYEAGVAKGKLETTVFGVALGVPLEKVSTGPFGQFQNCGDDEDSLTKLVLQLLRRNPDASPREEAVRRQVQIFLQTLETLLKSKGQKALQAAPVSDEQHIAKLFEEVKAMVRELPERVKEALGNRSGMETALGRADLNKAEYQLDRELHIAMQKNDVPKIVGIYSELGGLAKAQGDFRKAEAFVSYALKIAREFGGKAVDFRVRRELSSLLRALGNVAEADAWDAETEVELNKLIAQGSRGKR
jgi:hypothetical protein